MSQIVETAGSGGSIAAEGTEAHPPGLYALFTTEMWERFSYYGMRALLVLYLTKAIGLVEADALNLYAIYTGLIYLTPLIGGRMADRYLGPAQGGVRRRDPDGAGPVRPDPARTALPRTGPAHRW